MREELTALQIRGAINRGRPSLRGNLVVEQWDESFAILVGYVSPKMPTRYLWKFTWHEGRGVELLSSYPTLDSIRDLVACIDIVEALAKERE